MEKQLLLKEAATRKKLLALKQQLHADSGMHSVNKLTAKAQNEASAKITDDITTAPKTAQSEKLHVTEHEGNVQLSMSMSGNFPTRLNVKSQPSQAPPPSPTIANAIPNTKKISNHMGSDKSSVKEERKSKYKQSSFGSLVLDTTTLSHNTSTTDCKPEKFVASVDKAKRAISLSVDKTEVITTTDTKNSTDTSFNNTTPKPITKRRLAVPDTVKETEYMSAVSKQKARVSRIRKTIQAATIIQRAWRKYKKNHKFIN